MERLLRHEGESRDTDRLTWSHHRRLSGGQGAHREVGSERLEENHRVVINGSTSRVMNRSAKGGVRISRKEGQRFTACRSTVSHQVGPVLVRQDVVDFHSVTYAGQALDGYPRARARAH